MPAQLLWVTEQDFSTQNVAMILPVTPSEGNALIMMVAARLGILVDSITHTGASWTMAAEESGSADNAISLWYALDVDSTVTKNLTVNLDAGGTWDGTILVGEVYGIDRTAALDDTDTATGTSATPSTGNLVGSGTNRFFVTGIATILTATSYSAPANGFRQVTTAAGTPTDGQSLGWFQRSSKSAQTLVCSATMSASDSWATASAVFEETGLTTTEWTAAMTKSGAKPRILCQLFPAEGTVSEFVNGKVSFSGPLPTLSSISAANRSLDLLANRAQTSMMTLNFVRDDEMETLVSTYGIVGTKCKLWLGEEGLVRGDYAPFYTGIVDDVIPTTTTVTLKVKTSDELLKDRHEANAWTNSHPFTVIKEVLEDTFVNDELWDAASLDPNEDTAVSHLVVDKSRFYFGSESALRQPIKARSLVDEMLKLTLSQFVSQEDGVMRLVRVNPDASVTDNWTEDDLGDLRIASLYDNIVNEIILMTHSERRENQDDANARLEERVMTVLRDTDSRTRYGYKSIWESGIGKYERIIRLPSVSGNTVLGEQLLNTATTNDTFLVLGGSLYSMSGTRSPGFPVDSQPTEATLTAARPGYWVFYNDAKLLGRDFTIEPNEVEIIEIKTLTSNTAAKVFFNTQNGVPPDYVSQDTYPNGATATIANRGKFGTAATTWSILTKIYDVTPAVLYGQTILDLYANGGWTIDCQTSLAKYAVQRGDVVTLTTNRFLGFGKTSLDTTTKWLVVGKSVELDGEPPSIHWTLQFLQDSSPPASTLDYVFEAVPLRGGVDEQLGAAEAEDFADKYVADGLGLTLTGGLGIDIEVGIAQCAAIRIVIDKKTSLTLTASKDTYVGFDFYTRGLIVREVENGGNQPALSGTQIWLWKIITDSSSILHNFDLRTRQGLNGQLVVDGTVGTRHENADAEKNNIVPNSDFGIISAPFTISDRAPDNWTAAKYADDYAAENDQADPAFLSFDSGNFTADASPALTVSPFSGTVGGDDGVFLAVAMRTPSSITSIAQSGVTWTEVIRENGQTDTELMLWQGKVSGTVGTTVTLTLPAAGHGAWIYGEFENVDLKSGSGVVDTSSDTGTSATASTAACDHTASWRTLILGLASQDDGGAAADFDNYPDGFVEVAIQKGIENPNSTKQTLALAYKIVTTGPGTTAFSADLDASDNWACICAAVRSSLIEDFVAAPAIWGSEVDEETSIAVSGGRAIKIDPSAGSSDLPAIMTETLIPLEGGRIYRIEALVRVTNLSASTLVQARFYDSSKAWTGSQFAIAGTLPAVPGVDAWFRAITTSVTAAATRYVRLVFSHNDATPGISYINHVKIYRTWDSFKYMLEVGHVLDPRSIPDATATKLDAFSYDSGSGLGFDHDYGFNFSNSTYTVPKQGIYRFDAGAVVDDVADTKYCYLMFYKNGTEIIRGPKIINGTGAAADLNCYVSIASIGLTEGDTIEVYIYHNHGAARNVSAGGTSSQTYFSGAQLEGE
jgi:hypothetical protein